MPQASLRIEGRAGTDTINFESLPADFGGTDGADLMICGSHLSVDPSVAQILDREIRLHGNGRLLP